MSPLITWELARARQTELRRGYASVRRPLQAARRGARPRL